MPGGGRTGPACSNSGAWASPAACWWRAPRPLGPWSYCRPARWISTLADDATLAQVIHDFAQDGMSLIVLAETMTPGSGPLADQAFLRAVVRGSPRVPMDDDGVIRFGGVTNATQNLLTSFEI